MLGVLRSTTSAEGMRESVWPDLHGCSAHLITARERNGPEVFDVSPPLLSKETIEIVAYFRIKVFLLIRYSTPKRTD